MSGNTYASQCLFNSVTVNGLEYVFAIQYATVAARNQSIFCQYHHRQTVSAFNDGYLLVLFK